MRKRRCSFLRILILAILINERKLHGYSLYKKILYHTHMKWKPSIGTIYRTLNEMVKEELISKHTENRRYDYIITSKGVEYFIENLRVPIAKMAGILATVLEAYLKVSEEEPYVLTKDIRERLRTLKEVLQKYNL